MTDKELKEKVADIIMEAIEEYNNNEPNRPMIASLYAGKIISIINSLQEEPVSEELGEIVLEGTNFNKSWYAHPELAFKAGAKWQKEKLWKPADGDDLKDET